jgi:imidazole glycerol-phosphate synthase subunit HisH
VAIYVIDCGIGNVGAVRSMYRRLGRNAELIDTPRPLERGDRLILPGIGAFDSGAKAIDGRGFRAWLVEAAAAGHGILGICLGMQLLCRRSEEGSLDGLGIIPADVVRIDPGQERVRIPHMGWNIVTSVRDTPLLPTNGEQQRFYFTHSYRVRCDDAEHVWATTDYGEVFPSAIGCGEVMGVQFHPEKSHRFGMALLERFASFELADA